MNAVLTFYRRKDHIRCGLFIKLIKLFFLWLFWQPGPFFRLWCSFWHGNRELSDEISSSAGMSSYPYA
jgi:hypothetical protein